MNESGSPQVLKRNARVRRSAGEIIKDMAIIANHPELAYGTKFFALHNAIWMWTERYGKYEGCRDPGRPGCMYWSAQALSLVEGMSVRSDVSKKLRHEHIVPRIVLVDRILGTGVRRSRPWTEAALQQLFERYCIGVVVAKDEDDALNSDFQKAMPEGWDWGACAWARYAQVGLTVHEATVTWCRGKFNVDRRNKVKFAWPVRRGGRNAARLALVGA